MIGPLDFMGKSREEISLTLDRLKVSFAPISCCLMLLFLWVTMTWVPVLQEGDVDILITTPQFVSEYKVQIPSAGLLVVDDEHKVFEFYRHELRGSWLFHHIRPHLFV